MDQTTSEMTPVESGEWLVAQLSEADLRESTWLAVLGEFDAVQGWAADGQLSCIDWLVWRGGLARATAYEKLLVARQLRRRPALREAFADGRIRYSCVRLIARVENPDPETDEALIRVAEDGTVRDVERLVAVYRRYADQERAPHERATRRAVAVRPNLDGTSSVQITLLDEEVEEVMLAIQAFVDAARQAESADEAGADDDDGGGNDPAHSARADNAADSARADNVEGPPGVVLEHGTSAGRQADAVMDIVRTAVAHAGEGPAAGDERYMLHLVQTAEGLETLDGTVLDDATAERIACDAAKVAHVLGRDFEPLFLGRRTREWTTAQRRAARVRDGGRCRFPGCHRRVADLHHCEWWSRGGGTDISNGFLCCPRHHTLLHSGYEAKGDANREVTFFRPDGSVLGVTGIRPRTRSRL